MAVIQEYEESKLLVTGECILNEVNNFSSFY